MEIMCVGCQFGEMGTLATVSAVTAAIKSLNEVGEGEDILLVGYNGLMMPVMEVNRIYRLLIVSVTISNPLFPCHL